VEFHVAPTGSDDAEGTAAKPFKSLNRATQALASASEAKDGGHTIWLHEGDYYLSETWNIGSDASGKPGKTNHYKAVSGKQVRVSGAKAITQWTRDGDSERWTSVVPEVAAGDWYFRQLFCNSGELTLQRSRIPDTGWLRGQKGSHVKDEITRNVAGKEAEDWRKDRLDVYLTIGIREEDEGLIANWEDIKNGELLMIASWDASWHTLRDYNPDTKDLRLSTPGRYPVNHWHYSINKLGAPMRIENVKAGITQAGEWCLDAKTGTLTLLGKPGFDPNKAEIVAPYLETILAISGSNHKEPVSHLQFSGITFSHNVYRMGVYDRHQTDWPERMRKIDPTFPTTFMPGYTDAQATPKAGSAITLDHAQSIIFDQCSFVDIGNWGIHFRRDVHASEVRRSNFKRLGAGAFMIDPMTTGIPLEEFSSLNRLSDSTIDTCCVVHPAAVAVRIANARENTIEHNEISNLGYSAISVGWNWSTTPNQCYGNHIIGNDIHHITQVMSDGAGFYSLGLLGGTVVKGNYIHDVIRSESAVGASNIGMLMDQYSQGIHFDQNVIRRVQSYRPEDKRHNESHRHFRNQAAQHSWGENDFEHDDSPVKLTETVKLAGPR